MEELGDHVCLTFAGCSGCIVGGMVFLVFLEALVVLVFFLMMKILIRRRVQGYLDLWCLGFFIYCALLSVFCFQIFP